MYKYNDILYINVHLNMEINRIVDISTTDLDTTITKSWTARISSVGAYLN